MKHSHTVDYFFSKNSAKYYAINNYYHPQMKLWKGNVFTPVCQSFCSQGCVYPSMHWGRHPSVQCMLGYTPLAQCMLEYTLPPGQTPHPTATAADGTHPTGMYTCYLFIYYILLYYHPRMRVSNVFGHVCVCVCLCVCVSVFLSLQAITF